MRLRISGVIQGEGEEREEQLILVRSVKVKLKKISESVGSVFDERRGIKVAYEFGVADGFDTTVGECYWWRRGVGKNVYLRKNRMVVRSNNA